MNHQQKHFKEAYQKMPACLMGTIDHPKTVADLKFAAEHEVDMFNEDQDGHLEPEEISQVATFLAWLRKVGY